MEEERKKEEKKDEFAAWRKLSCTDPKKHNDKNFVYLVHAIQDDMGRAFRDAMRIRARSRAKTFDLIKNPEDVQKMAVISCSLIGRNQKEGWEQIKTWGRYGIILTVPPENILHCATQDLGANFLDPEREILAHKNDPKGDPQTLLHAGNKTYNEVVVLGSTEFGKAEVAGVFVNFSSPQKPTAKEIERALEMIYKDGKRIYPLVEIDSAKNLKT